MVEYKILEKMIPEMEGILSVVPGSLFCMKDAETLMILQRRMEDCQLKDALISFNEVFAMQDGCTIPKLKEAAVSLFKIKALVAEKQTDFSPKSYRILIAMYQAQCQRVGNILQLSEVNASIADEQQKMDITRTMEKNQAFLEAFRMEMAEVEKQIERLMLPVEREEETKTETIEKDCKEEKLVWKKPKKKSVLVQIQTYLTHVKERRKLEETLKEAEKASADTRCKEIPCYEPKLVYTEQFVCKDIPAYSILKHRNRIYFGLTKNVGRTSYDNQDQSLLELTEATGEFLQFLKVDLLSGEYEWSSFSKQEKEGLILYFHFLSECFQKHMGETLTVQEYLAFQRYYNKLVLQMFRVEQRVQETYDQALNLANICLAYMEAYDVPCSDDRHIMTENILNKQHETYILDLQRILQTHIVDDDARADLEHVVQTMQAFPKVVGKRQEKSTLLMAEKEQERDFPQPSYREMELASYVPPSVSQGSVQVIVQILNAEHEIVDQAFYSPRNLKQALWDYQNKRGYRKRWGFRIQGQDLFYQEEKESG